MTTPEEAVEEVGFPETREICHIFSEQILLRHHSRQTADSQKPVLRKSQFPLAILCHRMIPEVARALSQILGQDVLVGQRSIDLDFVVLRISLLL
jgi:hypothetical protein